MVSNPLRSLALVALAVGLAAAALKTPSAPPVEELALAPTVNPVLANNPSDLPLPSSGPLARMPTLTQLPDGRLAAAWLGGGDQDADEARIWFSLYSKGNWSAAQAILSRESAAGDTFARINRLSQPILFSEGGWLYLWTAAHFLGETRGQPLRILSTDGGKTWQKASRLSTSPLGSLASPLAAPPVPLADDSLLLPLRDGCWLHQSATGRLRAKHCLALPDLEALYATATVDRQQLLALIARPQQLLLVSSADAGQHWSSTPLPTPGAAQAASLLQINGGPLLLAANLDNRQKLALWTSHDQGKSWSAPRIVAQGDDGAADFGDPQLLQSRDGRIHLLYSARRQTIRHLQFNVDWLNEARP